MRYKSKKEGKDRKEREKERETSLSWKGSARLSATERGSMWLAAHGEEGACRVIHQAVRLRSGCSREFLPLDVPVYLLVVVVAGVVS